MERHHIYHKHLENTFLVKFFFFAKYLYICTKTPKRVANTKSRTYFYTDSL